jgi:hypothetical protein
MTQWNKNAVRMIQKSQWEAIIRACRRWRETDKRRTLQGNNEELNVPKASTKKLKSKEEWRNLWKKKKKGMKRM